VSVDAGHPRTGLRLADRYELTAPVASGGMGEVWAAHDDVLGRTVAVKLLKPEHAGDPTFIQRFRAEARNAASLAHPGIASVFDYGEADGVAYLVMELVPGEPLSALLARCGPLALPHALDLLDQTARALQAAHDAGVVHRDVKPANLLITPDGRVKVTDFGIARATDASPITRTGDVLGTVQYLSPEQATGGSATTASDVYALGVVAYEVLAGRRPFDEGTPVATALAHVSTPPAPLPAAVPAPVAAVVLQALAKDPAHRPAGAAAFGAALLVAGDLPARPARAASPVPPVTELAPVAAEPTRVLAAAPSAAAATTAAATAVVTTGRAGGRRRPAWLLPAWLLPALAVAAVLAVLLAAVGIDDRVGATPSAATAPVSTPTAGGSPSAGTRTAAPASARTSSTGTTATVTLNPRDYVGQPVQTARARLAALGLTARTVAGRVGSGRVGDVLAVSPTSGLARGSTVTLTVLTPAPGKDKGKGNGDGKGNGNGNGGGHD
jgi:hypothetical protein